MSDVVIDDATPVHVRRARTQDREKPKLSATRVYHDAAAHERLEAVALKPQDLDPESLLDVVADVYRMWFSASTKLPADIFRSAPEVGTVGACARRHSKSVAGTFIASVDGYAQVRCEGSRRSMRRHRFEPGPPKLPDIFFGVIIFGWDYQSLYIKIGKVLEKMAIF